MYNDYQKLQQFVDLDYVSTLFKKKNLLIKKKSIRKVNNVQGSIFKVIFFLILQKKNLK